MMKIAFFDAHAFEKSNFEKLSRELGCEITFLEARLTSKTASLAQGHPVVCVFVNDDLSPEVLEKLGHSGVKLIALRSAGFNNVNLDAAEKWGIKVVRVPEYSPYAVAEHAVALILTLNRKIHRASNRVHEGNFSLNGLVGFDLHGKTVGVIGTGRIGSIFAKIMQGFGCKVLAFDVNPMESLKQEHSINYVSFEELLNNSDIISLHVPLNPSTHHLINENAFCRMKKGVMLVNTGRGALIDTRALIKGLKGGHIGYAALDVYEEEEGIFFKDLSDKVLQDDILARLMTFPNVLLTSHQAFLTNEALENIASTTMENIIAFKQGEKLQNEVCAKVHLNS